jgi:hypothetical protein
VNNFPLNQCKIHKSFLLKQQIEFLSKSLTLQTTTLCCQFHCDWTSFHLESHLRTSAFQIRMINDWKLQNLPFEVAIQFLSFDYVIEVCLEMLKNSDSRCIRILLFAKWVIWKEIQFVETLLVNLEAVWPPTDCRVRAFLFRESLHHWTVCTRGYLLARRLWVEYRIQWSDNFLKCRWQSRIDHVGKEWLWKLDGVVRFSSISICCKECLVRKE